MLDTLLTLAATVDPSAVTGGAGNPVTDIANTFKVDAPFLIAQVVNFLLVAGILWYFAIRPTLNKVDERQRKIADGLQYAEEMKGKLAETEKKYNESMKKANQEAQQIIEDAREHAKRLMDKQTQEAVARAEELILAAKRSAEKEKEKMLEDVRAEVTELVVATTAKVLRKELSEEERKTYTEASAQQLHAKN